MKIRPQVENIVTRAIRRALAEQLAQLERTADSKALASEGWGTERESQGAVGKRRSGRCVRTHSSLVSCRRAQTITSGHFFWPSPELPIKKGMRSSRFDFITWMTGYSGWSFYCALMSTFALTGYYSELLRPRVPDWAVVALFITPIIAILFIQWGELPDRVVSVCHIAAASLFMTLALGMEVGHLLGYQPKGSLLFRVLAHIGWTFAWGGIYRRARANSARYAKRDMASNGGLNR